MKKYLAVIVLMFVSSLASAQTGGALETNLKFKIPRSSSTGESLFKPDPLRLSVEVNESGLIKINSQNAGRVGHSDDLMDVIERVVKARKAAGLGKENTAFLRVDRAANYRDVVVLVVRLKEAGIDPLNLVVENSEFPIAFITGTNDKAVAVEISEKAEFFIGDRKIERKSLKRVVAEQTKTRKDDFVSIKAGLNVAFGAVIDLLNELRAS